MPSPNFENSEDLLLVLLVCWSYVPIEPLLFFYSPWNQFFFFKKIMPNHDWINEMVVANPKTIFHKNMLSI